MAAGDMSVGSRPSPVLIFCAQLFHISRESCKSKIMQHADTTVSAPPKVRKNASNRTVTGFRMQNDLLARLDAYVAARPDCPTRTQVIEEALHEYLDRQARK